VIKEGVSWSGGWGGGGGRECPEEGAAGRVSGGGGGGEGRSGDVDRLKGGVQQNIGAST